MNILLLITLLLLPTLASAADEFVLSKPEMVKLVNRLTTAEAQRDFCEKKYSLAVESNGHKDRIIEIERGQKEELVKVVDELRQHDASADEILVEIRSYVDKLAQENEELRGTLRWYRVATTVEIAALVIIGILAW